MLKAMEQKDKNTLVYDVINAVLFLGVARGFWTFFPVIARSRLYAGEFYIGFLGIAAYSGYIWSILFHRFHGKFAIQRSMLLFQILSSITLFIAAFIINVPLYCFLIAIFLLSVGGYQVQYNTLAKFIYSDEVRVKRLNMRQFSIAVAQILFAPFFGFLISRTDTHKWAFLIGTLMIIISSIFLFKNKNVSHHKAEVFNFKEIIYVLKTDRRFQMLLAVLIIYAWVGTGLSVLLPLLYVDHLGLNEVQVGILASVSTLSIMGALAVITPFLKFDGAIKNFRLTYLSAIPMCFIFLWLAVSDPGVFTFPLLLLAVVLLGISNAGFELAMQTAPINLSKYRKFSVYVYALRAVQGIRGITFPLLVTLGISLFNLQTMFVVAFIAAVVCGLVTVLIKN